MSSQLYKVGDRVEKLCAICREERGHVVASVSKKGLISRVSCPKCGTRSSYKKNSQKDVKDRTALSGAPYDRTYVYKRGQIMLHPVYGEGEVTAVIEALKIDVLFKDRMRRLIHAREQGA
jgi:hypothetical protein